MKFFSWLKKIFYFFVKDKKKSDRIPYDPKKDTSFDIDAHVDPYEDKD